MIYVIVVAAHHAYDVLNVPVSVFNLNHETYRSNLVHQGPKNPVIQLFTLSSHLKRKHNPKHL